MFPVSSLSLFPYDIVAMSLSLDESMLKKVISSFVVRTRKCVNACIYAACVMSLRMYINVYARIKMDGVTRACVTSLTNSIILQSDPVLQSLSLKSDNFVMRAF